MNFDPQATLVQILLYKSENSAGLHVTQFKTEENIVWGNESAIQTTHARHYNADGTRDDGEWQINRMLVPVEFVNAPRANSTFEDFVTEDEFSVMIYCRPDDYKQAEALLKQFAVEHLNNLKLVAANFTNKLSRLKKTVSLPMDINQLEAGRVYVDDCGEVYRFHGVDGDSIVSTNMESVTSRGRFETYHSSNKLTRLAQDEEIYKAGQAVVINYMNKLVENYGFNSDTAMLFKQLLHREFGKPKDLFSLPKNK